MRVHKSDGRTSFETGQEATTDAEGRFDFTRVPREDLLLRFNASDVQSKYHEFLANDPGDDVVVVLACQSKFRFEPVANLPAPQSLRVLDAAMLPLRMERQVGDGLTEGGQRLAWTGAAGSNEFAVSDTAAWLVLEANGREIRRLPLLLLRGEVNVVGG